MERVNANVGNTIPDSSKNEAVDKINESLQNGFSFDLGFNDSMTPLESLLHSINIINILIIVVLTIILYLMLMYYVHNYSKNIMSNFSDKYLSNKFKYYFDKISFLGRKNFNRYIIIMLIVNTVLLLVLVSMS